MGRKLARNGAFFRLERTGESATKQDFELLAGILSVQHKNGALWATRMGAEAVLP